MRRSFLKYSFLGLFMFSLILISGCDDDDPSLNIVDLARTVPELSMLVEALEITGLDVSLTVAGPLTVFAPANSGFEQFLADNNFSDLSDVPVGTLTSVLLNHVLGTSVPSSGITSPIYATGSAETPFGNNIFATLYITNDGTVQVNGQSNVTGADNEASNGIVHIVDNVIALPTVVTYALADTNFSILVAALTRPDLPTDFVDVLTGTGPFTVFAPVNQAFRDLLASNPDWDTLDDIPAATLDKVLRYHVTNVGNVRSSDLVNNQEINTLATGEILTVDLLGAAPGLEDATGEKSDIIFADVQGFNGVVHVIDRVLIPNL